MAAREVEGARTPETPTGVALPSIASGPVGLPVDRRAIADAIPLFLPAIPFGFVVGLAVTESARIPAGVGWASSSIIFAGASQLAVITIAGTASAWSAIAAGLVINSRHLMYSAALAPAFRDQPRWFRWLGPYVLIDQTFALAVLRIDAPPAEFRRYFLTAGVFFWAMWQVVVGLGLIVGPAVPEDWQLGFAVPVMFAGLLVVMVTRRPALVAALVGGSVGLATVGLPNRFGIVVGALAGVVAGAAVDRDAVVEEEVG